MEIFAWEQWHHFVDDVLEELKHIFLTRAHHYVFNTPNHARRRLLALARKLWISSDCSHFVAREFKFWHNGDKAVSRIFHDILDLLLSVISSMDSAFAFHTA